MKMEQQKELDRIRKEKEERERIENRKAKQKATTGKNNKAEKAIIQGAQLRINAKQAEQTRTIWFHTTITGRHHATEVRHGSEREEVAPYGLLSARR